MPTTDHYNSLDDFLISRASTVDAEVELGSFSYPAKGREIDATTLFSDISGYSARTLDLTPVETLAFVNHFFTWVTAVALRGTHGIVDKYIGDEMMVVFSKEFGSEDPFEDAVQVARKMGEQALPQDTAL
jgi:class 3 adenylate cyclase